MYIKKYQITITPYFRSLYQAVIHHRYTPKIVFFSCVLFIILSNIRAENTIQDAFHFGEFIAAATTLLNNADAELVPLSIHGALDILPTLFAKYFWGPNNYFIPLQWVHTLLNSLAGIILLLIIHELTKSTYKKHIYLISTAVVASHLVSLRDLLLLFPLYLFIIAQFRNLFEKPSHSILFIFGSVLAVGCFWSFDRGIAALSSIGAAIIIMSWNKNSIVSFISSFVGTIVLLSFSSHFFSASHYIENLLFLIETSSQWSLGWKYTPVSLTIYATLINVAAFALYLSGYQRKQPVYKHASIIMLVLLMLFYLKIGSNRADLFHIQFSLWIPFLLASCSVEYYKPNRYILTGVFILFLCADVVNFKTTFLVTILLLIYITCKHENSRYSKWIRSGIHFLLIGLFTVHFAQALIALPNNSSIAFNQLRYPPSNQEVTSNAIQWVSSELVSNKTSCIFDLVNNGVINGITNLPACTKYTYPVYANRNYEENIISMLEAKAPNVVVYSSDYWSYAIDGRSMVERFPMLNSYLLNAYRHEKCRYGYCLRYITKP